MVWRKNLRNEKGEFCMQIHIVLTDEAYPCAGEYRLHTDDGKPSICVLNKWYEAHAADKFDNEYRVIWRIRDDYDEETDDAEYACDWDSPAEVVGLWKGGEIVTEKVILCL